MRPAAEAATLAAILLSTAALLIYQDWHTGVTADEPGHLVSARLFWKGGDRLRPQDMPPVIKIVAGWVPALMALPLPADLGRPGEDRREWEVAIDMMQRLPPASIQGVFFWSRLPLAIFPLLTTVLIWWWARQLFAHWIALTLAALFALEPTALAHGALFKNDLAATFSYLLFWFSVWRYWRQPTLTRACALGALAALAMLTKLSMLFLVPLAAVLVLLRLRKLRAVVWAALALIACYAVVTVAYRFDVRPLTAAEWQFASRAAYVPRSFVAIAWCFQYVPMPTSLWTGLITLFSNTSFDLPVYMLARVWPQGNPFYFPFALLVKVPVTLWALMTIGLALGIVERRIQVLWLLPGAVYIALASTVPLQLGVRLVLPAMPFGLLICAFSIDWLSRTRTRALLLGGLAALLLFESARVYPCGIAFFNLAAGGPSNGFRYLADSNLDWGQGLGDLARYTRQHHIPSVRLSYFGNDMMYRYFLGNQVVPLAPPWSEQLVKSDRLVPEPGAWYAISPTLIPGQFFAPRFKDYYAAFRTLEPVARPGYSIFVYHIESGAK